MWSLVFVVLLGAFLYWRALTPSHEGRWQPLQERLPEVSLEQGDAGEFISLRGLRDFRYGAGASVVEARYLEADYHLADLTGVWLGISHFGKPGLAHTFLSFEFNNTQFLVASIEARLRPEQGYHPIWGLVRQYSKILVFGTEADVIGLRSHVRRERVLLYPLRVSPEQGQQLLKALATEAAALQQTPDFYNTLLDNCTTGLLKYQPDYRWYASLLDYRVLLPGYVDGLLQEQGWLDAEGTLIELRQRAQVNPELTKPGDEQFSLAIRQSWYDDSPGARF